MKMRSKVLAVLTAAGVLGVTGTALASVNINFETLEAKRYRPIARTQPQRPPELPRDFNGQRPPMPPEMSRDMKGHKRPPEQPMSHDMRHRPPEPPSGDRRPPEMPRR